MKRIDLHIHSTYSDGTSSIKAIIQMAKAKGLSYIAITDHFTSSWKQSIIDTINFKNFEAYRQEIIKERKLISFNCLIGIEIDMDSNFEDICQIPFNKFELLLFEYVDSLVTFKKLEALIQESEIAGIKALAHNSYFKLANAEKFSKILVDNDIYFELNTRYLNRFDEEAIVRLKILNDYGVKFTMGSDAHVQERIGVVNDAVSILERLDGLENLIDLDKFGFDF